MPDQEFVSLEELCGEDPERDHKVKELPRYSKDSKPRFIKYRARVPLERLLKLQRKYRMGSPKADQEGYYAEMLLGLLINPRVPDMAAAKALLKGDGGVLIQIVGEATGAIETEQETAVAEEAGESLLFGSKEEPPQTS